MVCRARWPRAGRQTCVLALPSLDLAGRRLLPVDRLKEMCVAAIIRTLSVENVLDALILAECRGCDGLMDSCIPLFKENLKDLRVSEKWKEMQKNPALLSKLLASFAD